MIAIFVIAIVTESIAGVFGVQNHTTKQICYSCPKAALQSDCNEVETCDSHQECFTKRLTDSFGQIYFQSGCISKTVCDIYNIAAGVAPAVAGKRQTLTGDLTNCLQCCNSLVKGSGCNRDLCNKRKPSQSVTCMRCSDVTNPEYCNRITECGRDEMCFTRSEQNLANHEERISMGCENRRVCDIYNQQPTTDGFFCTQCCNSDYCNLDLCGVGKQIKPKITQGPKDRNMSVGDIALLRCDVNNGSNANISWSFLSPRGDKTVPNGAVTFGANNAYVLVNIQSGTFGKWTCKASNSFGSDIAFGYIHDGHYCLIGLSKNDINPEPEVLSSRDNTIRS